MVKKYMHENLKHTVIKHLAKNKKVFTLSDNYYHQYQTRFRFHIKQYWHFHGVTPKQYYILFQTSNNTDIFRELLVNNTTEFISSNTGIFREFLPNKAMLKIYSKSSNSPQLWFEDPILGVLTPNWATTVVWG